MSTQKIYQRCLKGWGQISAGSESGIFRDSVDIHTWQHCVSRDQRYDRFLTGHKMLAEVLSDRLSNRVREELGLSYGARRRVLFSDRQQQIARYRAEFVTADASQQSLLRATKQVFRQLASAAGSTEPPATRFTN